MRNMSKKVKLVLKEANQKIVDKYSYCVLDHHKEKSALVTLRSSLRVSLEVEASIPNRIQPEDVIINLSHLLVTTERRFVTTTLRH